MARPVEFHAFGRFARGDLELHAHEFGPGAPARWNGTVPTTRLGEPEIEQALAALSDWRRDGDVIRKSYARASFADAVAFVVQVGFLAEAMNHHPDIDVRWRTVHLALSTHDAGGLTELDMQLAARIDAIA